MTGLCSLLTLKKKGTVIVMPVFPSFNLLFGRFMFLFLKVSGSGNFPEPLEPEQERECFIKMKNGDGEARKTLIEHNLRLVAHIIKKYGTSGTGTDDLMSLGTIGLIKAIDSFDIENGTKFATYASKCLQNEILMHFRSKKKLSGEVSLGDTIDTDKDGNPLTYMDIISCEDTIADDIDFKIKFEKANAAINHLLTPRERNIIILRYGLNGNPPIPQREIAEMLHISRSYVSRIEKKALQKLRSAL